MEELKQKIAEKKLEALRSPKVSARLSYKATLLSEVVQDIKDALVTTGIWFGKGRPTYTSREGSKPWSG